MSSDNPAVELVRAACDAQARAYAPYSKFRVGAALRTQNGNIYTGANIENASYSVTICAERVALGTAVAAGERQFTALAIASAGGHAPCGACRQALAEFCPDLRILLVDTTESASKRPATEPQVTETSLADLLPAQFKLPSD